MIPRHYIYLYIEREEERSGGNSRGVSDANDYGGEVDGRRLLHPTVGGNFVVVICREFIAELPRVVMMTEQQ